MARSRHRSASIALALAGLLVVASLAYLLPRWPTAAKSVDGAVPALKAQGAAPVRVEVVEVRPGRLVDEVAAVGSLSSNESVLLRPEVAGRIAAIHFRDGEAVRRGSLLFRLDASVQAAELQQAEAQLALARATQQRNEDLFQKQFISRQALDASKAALQVQEAARALAAARLDKTRILAPFDGIVGIRKVSPGDYVKEGEALVNIEDIATLKVDFRLPEGYFSRLQSGLELEVSADALPGEVFRARLAAVDPLVDAGGRAVACRALLPNPGMRLRPGMFVRVRLVFGERADALMIPEQAVVSGAETQVFRVEAGQARAVPVRLGARRAGWVEVRDGLRPGDRVISAGQQKVRDGQAVQPVDQP